MNELKDAYLEVIENLRVEYNSVWLVTNRLVEGGPKAMIQCLCGHLFFEVPHYARYDGNAWRWPCDRYRPLRHEFDRHCKLGLYLPYVVK